jgi:hypothetical protein
VVSSLPSRPQALPGQSSLNWTPATPLPPVSLAVAVMATGEVVKLAPLVGAVIETVGGVVSQAAVEAEILAWGDLLAAASKASIARV